MQLLHSALEAPIASNVVDSRTESLNIESATDCKYSAITKLIRKRINCMSDLANSEERRKELPKEESE